MFSALLAFALVSQIPDPLCYNPPAVPAEKAAYDQHYMELVEKARRKKYPWYGRDERQRWEMMKALSWQGSRMWLYVYPRP